MAPSVPSAKLLTLGQLALVDGEGRSLVPPGSTKLLSVLAFLAATPGRRTTREHLVDLFWDDVDPRNARASLRTSLHRLRVTLGADYLPAGDDDITLTDRLACDRDEFLTAIAAGELEAAISRYGGEYVPGFVSKGSAGFEHWRDAERDRLSSLFAASAETMAQRALSEGTPQVAASLAGRLLAQAPLNERAWRLRLRAEQQLGSRVHLTASLAELRRLIETMPWAPDPRTLQLIESLERPTHAATADEPAPEPTLVTDLVGRGALLATLYAAWRDTSRHRAIHIHLVGRAGLGKSRLLDDFAARLRAERARVVRARAHPRQRALSGALLSTLVGALAELPGAAGMSAHSARILLPVHPGIAARFPDASPLEFTDPDARFLAVLGAVEDLLDAVSHEAPCCLLLDDAHWWDDPSRRLIEQLLERAEALPLLVVTASRPGPGALSARCTRDTLGLTPLATEDVLAMVQSLGEHADSAAMQRLAEALRRGGDGVPLMVIEGIRLGLDRDLLGLTDRQWCLNRLGEFLGILHPGRLLEERLALLSAAERQLLLTAWIAETTVTAEELPRLESDAGAAAELERLGFLTSHAGGWAIAHDSIGEALETSEPPSVLQHAHRLAGLLARGRGESPLLLSEAARHFVDADARRELRETAIIWLRQARAAGSKDVPLALLRELCGPTAHPRVIAELLSALPPDLRRRPWTMERLLPYVSTALLLAVVSAWMVSRRPAPPDVGLALLLHDSTGHLVESRLDWRERDWTSDDVLPHAMPTPRPSPWDGTVTPTDGWPIKDPLRDRWVVAHNLAASDPNGPTDLDLHEGGSVRRLATAPGDDVSPTWSPDGRFVAFATTRWSPAGDAVFNLAVLEIATGALRRLTSGAVGDVGPHWSPDGTRIAYVQHSAPPGADSLCWVTFDGGTRGCRGVAGRDDFGAVGWLPGGLLLVSWIEGYLTRHLSVSIDGGPNGPLEVLTVAPVAISPDGRWLAELVNRVEGRDSGTTLNLLALASPAVRRTVRVSALAVLPMLYWTRSAPPLAITEIAILRRRDTLAVGAPTRLAVEGTDTIGRVLPVPPAVVRWATSDSTIAAVEDGGVVVGRRPGSVVVTASAGGWRTATARLVVVAGQSESVFEEDWSTDWRGRWTSWGDPLPRIEDQGVGRVGRAMLPNGDGVYSSGLVSKALLDARNGLALDVEMSTPITASKWQFVDLGLREDFPPSPSGPIGSGCTLRYPGGEGGGHQVMVGGVPADPMIPAGSWYRLRIQLFPDGTCGLAVNGRAIRRDSTVRVTPKTMRVALGGQTVGSRLLIGRVTVTSGVPGDVSWIRPAK